MTDQREAAYEARISSLSGRFEPCAHCCSSATAQPTLWRGKRRPGRCGTGD